MYVNRHILSKIMTCFKRFLKQHTMMDWFIEEGGEGVGDKMEWKTSGIFPCVCK